MENKWNYYLAVRVRIFKFVYRKNDLLNFVFFLISLKHHITRFKSTKAPLYVFLKISHDFLNLRQ